MGLSTKQILQPTAFAVHFLLFLLIRKQLLQYRKYLFFAYTPLQRKERHLFTELTLLQPTGKEPTLCNLFPLRQLLLCWKSKNSIFKRLFQQTVDSIPFSPMFNDTAYLLNILIWLGHQYQIGSHPRKLH